MTTPRVEDVLTLMEPLSEADEARIRKAHSFAEKVHENQKRAGGDPYFFHVFETARSLAKIGMSPTTIVAGYLHDVIEDCNVSQGEMEKEFGKEVVILIDGVTKLSKIEYTGVKRHVESLRKFFIAMSKDIRVLIIRLADRMHNMTTLKDLPEYKQKRIAEETLEIYAPIAYRLGIRHFSRELEELAFPYVYPKEHGEISQLLKSKWHENEKHLEKFRKSVQKTLAKEGLVNAQTEYRIKGRYSFYKKFLRKDKDANKVYDVVALRIIVPTIEDCYQVLGIVHKAWRPLPGRIKDYISFQKPDGYRSLHTTVFTGDGGLVEIQIRTPEMHREALYGIVLFLSHKETKSKQKKVNPHFIWLESLIPKNAETPIPQWINELAEFQSTTMEKNYISELKRDFFEDRIFVFTPKGDVVDLPTDSTPIDYAYAIHSDIGNHIVSAKINGKLVTLHSELQNGDIVDIQTKSTAKPNKKWLRIVKTTLARRHIRSYFQEQEKE